MQFCTGLPGCMKSIFTPQVYAHASKARLVNSQPLSVTITGGSPRSTRSRSSTSITRTAGSELATSIRQALPREFVDEVEAAEASTVTSASAIKSMLQRWSAGRTDAPVFPHPPAALSEPDMNEAGTPARFLAGDLSDRSPKRVLRLPHRAVANRGTPKPEEAELATL
jgi:hypothetical protein